MKTISPQLLAFLNAARTRDFPLAMADCYTITLVNQVTGGSIRFTDYDQDIVWQGNTFEAQAVLIQGVKFKCSVGLEVDRQQVTIVPSKELTINGAPWMVAIRDGAFDGATFQRDRVFMDPMLPGGIDGLTLFSGRVSTVDKVGRVSAQLTIASPMVVLDYYMPRNVYSPTCLWMLYEPNTCQVNPTEFETQSRVGPGSTQTVINCTDGTAATQHAQGSMIFNSGPNAGLRATVKAVSSGQWWQLMYPLPEIPLEGDSILVYFGCDHTYGTCQGVFKNGAHFRAFPNVPPPDYAI